MKKTLTISATLAAVIALAGCSSGSASGGSSMPGMDHSTMAASPVPAAGDADHNGSDAMFAQVMIPHHAQAVEMSDMILKKQGIDARVTALATKIKAAQAPEIEKMTGWLNDWNEPTQAPGGHSMTGMMNDDDLEKLNAAQRTEAARLFLSQMIAHHEGAVEMANAEVRSGQDAAAIQLGKDIAASQTGEIQDMKDLLVAL
ncbi:DUF305 domain-containing protein [Arthrobacter sp. PsM3]|uniref:DUF305 domain-containing protein n=1 Tax=Arthrobacter sp. PsM3 TaxID=3030531 RepID=UPI00263B32A3|nr:DUF305 domain-containing protein [Arthrobacter sp. PsM3]MDN4643164.1 DUF305 domain-containing protein [Arthrobacter sp. PsM3]